MEDPITNSCPFCRTLVAVNDPSVDKAREVVWQFPHSVAFLGDWQYYQGYCVLIARRHARELHELEDAERRAYLDEMCVLARAIADCFQPLKLNYELLGNQVPHLHWHLFPRYRQDPNYLKPVWLTLERANDDEATRQRLQSSPGDRRSTILTLRRGLEQLMKEAAAKPQ
jgi:diadenosine tetraphosphate (Ap4A) HIT family hydrolase